MTINLLSATVDGWDIILLSAFIIVSIMLAIALFASTILRIMIFFSYWVTNRERTSGGYTGETAALKLLSELGYNDIQVKRCGFFRMLFYSNHYNPKKKTIYLRSSVFYGAHLTAIGLALQKVGLVIQDKRDSKAFMARWKLQQLSLFGPIVFIPLILIGLVLDFLMASTTGVSFTGVCTLISAILALIFFIACFVLSFLTVKVEGRANKETLEIMKNYDFLNAYEQEKVAKVFKTYLFAYIVDFITNLLEIIKLIVQIAIKINQNKK